jgi:hypothetical protein
MLAALVLAGAACDSPSGPGGRSAVIAVTVDTVVNPMVRAVTLTLKEPGPAQVTWGAAGTPVLTLTADSVSSVHRFLLPRLRAGRDYLLQGSVPGETATPLQVRFTTGALPPELAAIEINLTGTPTLPVALIEIAGSTQFQGLLMVEEGEVVGFLPMVGSLFGARRRANGEIVLLDAAQGLVCYRIDGTVAHQLPQADVGTPYGRIHHDVVATPDDRLLFIANETQLVGLDTVVGEALWEWTPETNAVVKKWSAFDFLDWTTLRGSRSVPGNWLHGNGLSFGPRGNVLMSLRNADQVISIAPDFGRLEWALGGTTGTLAVADSNRFWGQHYVSEPTEGRVLVFDNGFERPEGAYTRAIEYAIDASAGTATRVWQYRHEPDIYAALVGSARRQPGGNTVVLFGMLAGQIASSGPITAVEVRPDGALVWRLTFGPELTRLYRLTPVASVVGEQPGAFRSR